MPTKIRPLNWSIGVGWLLAAVVIAPSTGQAPAAGMRPSDVRSDALVHARVVTAPGEVLEDATVILKDGWIVAVGTGLVPTPDSIVHDCSGLTIYPGLIDAHVAIPSEAAARAKGNEAGAPWNKKVIPHLSAGELPLISASMRTELRNLGFTTAAAFPDWGVFRGTGETVLLASEDSRVRVIGRRGSMLVGFSHDTDWDSATYPGSLAGAVALVRQSFIDADWITVAQAAWDLDPSGDDAPQGDLAVGAIAAARAGAASRVAGAASRVAGAASRVAGAASRPSAHGPIDFLFDGRNELEELLASKVTREFGLRSGVLGSGLEFRRLNEVAAMELPMVIPLNFPKTPELTDPSDAEVSSLKDLATWAVAPRNCALLSGAGVDYCITTSRLQSRGEFPERVRKAMTAGLSEAQLLEALTVAPARLLGIDDISGTIAPGKLANLVVTEGPLFARDTKVRDVWVAGRRNEVSRVSPFAMGGPLIATMPDGTSRPVELNVESPRLAFPKNNEQAEAIARGLLVDDDRAIFTIDGWLVGTAGTLRCSAIRDGAKILVTCHKDDGATVSITIGAEPAVAPDQGGAAQASTATPAPVAPPTPALVPSDSVAFDPSTIPLTSPFGDFGLLAPPTPQTVLVRDATIWTSSPAGVLEHCDMLVRDGRISRIGPGLVAPPGALVLECAGKHLTAGLVDCHSHSGLEGGVNEGTQACTAEVRMADAFDPTDIAWYRELAGGLTSANQLHGSANPIGGQNCVVKLRWGSDGSLFRIPDAKPGIKFALGENVVRNKRRYPNTRMGVEAFLRDQFREASERAAEFAAWEALPPGERQRTVPPRRDLELEALSEILRGDRIIHCHAYRQDEILMILRLAEDLGFRLGTLQHVLEGYKIGEVLASHGAGASSFADWWGYKVEVMDAIPANGSIMADSGVLVSFNSDSDELARHLNTEAAKAVKYGGTSPAKALEFVTINPARQLGIGHRTGSLEIGKDADFVIWSGDPLSSFTRCEQTWIEGAKYFDRIDDAELRTRDASLRQRLIAFAIAAAAQEKRESAADLARKAGLASTPSTVPAAPVTQSDAPTSGSLLQRMLQAREDSMLQMWQSGLDPTTARQGECGCSGGAR